MNDTNASILFVESVMILVVKAAFNASHAYEISTISSLLITFSKIVF